MSISLRTAVIVAVAAYMLLLVYPAILEPTTTWYRLSTAVQSVRNLLSLPRSDIEACIEAYQFLQNGTRTTDTAETTAHVRAYYKVLQEVLAVADIEKMYIPPQLDSKLGLFGNQLLIEQQVASDLQVVAGDRVLDIGCGRGRVAHHVATLTGAHVSGYNIDPRQIENANAFAAAEGMQDQLSFQEGDHHLRWGYDDASFDAAYDMQALWPFINKANGELEHVASEMFRVLKPGARFSGIDYLLTEWFDWNNPKHENLHRLFLPTLAATQSNYHTDVTNALQAAGFQLVLSAPSEGPAWPLTDQKTEVFEWLRSFINGLNYVGLAPAWALTLVDNLMLGGKAWVAAEKAKLADLTWRIIVQKPV